MGSPGKFLGVRGKHLGAPGNISERTQPALAAPSMRRSERYNWTPAESKAFQHVSAVQYYYYLAGPGTEKGGF
eukprot:1309470-Rhodomonas_salina.1